MTSWTKLLLQEQPKEAKSENFDNLDNTFIQKQTYD